MSEQRQTEEHRAKKDDDDPRDDVDDGGGGSTAGPFIVVAVALFAVVFAIGSFIGGAKSQFATPPTTGTCTTSGWGFVMLECPGDRFIGPTFGFWACGNGPSHPCGTNPP